MIRISQNPYDSQARREKRAKRAKHLCFKVTKIYEHKPFFERWYLFNLYTKLGGWLCQLVSPMSALVVLFFVFYDQSETLLGRHFALALSLMLALTICAGVEALKRYSTQNALVEIFNYKRASLALVIAFLCSLASISTSFYGAYTTPSRFYTPPALQSPPLEDLAKLDQTYIGKIEAKREAIEAKKAELASYEQNNQSSSAKRLSRRAGVREGHEALASQLHALENELGALNLAHLAKLDEAKAQNAQALDEAQATLASEQLTFETSTHERGLLLGWFSLGFESLFWAFLMFNMWYYKRAELEFQQFPDLVAQPTLESPLEATTQPLQANQTQPTPQPAQIGFKTSIQQLANRCKMAKDSEGNLGLSVEGKVYSLERLRNNYHANKSKARKYERAGNVEQSDKYKKASQKWLAYIDILKSNLEAS